MGKHGHDVGCHQETGHRHHLSGYHGPRCQGPGHQEVHQEQVGDRRCGGPPQHAGGGQAVVAWVRQV